VAERRRPIAAIHPPELIAPTAQEDLVPKNRVRLAVIGLFVAVVIAVADAASAETINKCNAAKRKCVAKLATALLGCHAKAVKGGDPVDAECLDKAHTKFDGGATATDGCFEKLETKFGVECLTQDDQAIVETRVDAFVADVVAALEPSYPAVVTSPCTAGKLKCVAQNNAALLNCQAKAALKGTLDPKCVLKAQQKFDGALLDPPDASKGCFEKLEEKADGCLTTDDTAALAQEVASAVQTADCGLDPLDPNCACPTRLEFTPDATDPASFVDLGWMGLGHRQRLVSNASVAYAVEDCANPSQPCGACTLRGPLDPPENGRTRCTGNTAIRCTADAQCVGFGTCEVFLGAPIQVHGGGVTTCLVRHAQGAAGTFDLDAGDGSITMSVTTRTYVGQLESACPRCTNDLCQSGARFMNPCTVDGTSPTPGVGDLSLDCPPSPSALVATSTAAVTSATGFTFATLTADQPFCRAFGATAKKCFCDTCNSGTYPNALVPCTTNADCPDPAGPIGPICGGLRCLGGANNGAACTVGADCASGTCSVPGEPTKPNSCNDGVCEPDGQGHALCPSGPSEGRCAPTYTHVSCLQDADCAPFPGDTCSGLKIRACFLDNGNVGGQILGAGVASPTEPTFASLSCVPPSQTAVNVVFGYPGPARVTERGSLESFHELPHRVFATSTVHSGALGGLAGADAICQARADAAALGGTFRAWLSDAFTSAASRLTKYYGDYVLMDGTLVARGWSDLLDGVLLAPIAQDETGAAVTGSAWTNATVWGAIDSAECAFWTSTAAGDFGQTGSTAATNEAWTDEIPFEDCAQERRLYCIEQ
jgi:hypothetical protein